MPLSLYFVLGLFLFGFPVLSQEEASPQDRLIVESLVRLNRFDVSENEKWKGAVLPCARSLRLQEGYFELVEQFSIVEEVPELIRLVEQDATTAEASQAAKLIFDFGEHEKLANLLFSAAKEKAPAYITLIGFVKTAESRKLLERFYANNKSTLSPTIKAPARLSTLEEIEIFSARSGNVKDGRGVFQKFCFACHKVGNYGMEFGPGLSEIGDKLPKSELLLSIVKPNAGISFDYEGWTIQTRQGETFTGVISEGGDDLIIRMMGGLSQRIKKVDISKRSKMEVSLMPEGLHLAMTKNELIDLVEFLSSLRK
jgi:putative heme-binding domain-containing protein